MIFFSFQNEYASRILERDSQEALGGDGVSSEQSDNNIFLEVVGGVDKKKRIFGLGPEGQNQFPSSTQSARISVSEYMQMKTECMQIKAENQILKEQMSGLHANQEKLLKFMEAFSQSHPRPPSPNEEGQQDDNEYFDELDG